MSKLEVPLRLVVKVGMSKSIFLIFTFLTLTLMMRSIDLASCILFAITVPLAVILPQTFTILLISISSLVAEGKLWKASISNFLIIECAVGVLKSFNWSALVNRIFPSGLTGANGPNLNKFVGSMVMFGVKVAVDMASLTPPRVSSISSCPPASRSI
ncbi:hypothetical protein SDC9_203073 [bioreactor metagenome]|uniref:Uncharacterized protein n=1 Tax=bioreactor metagenome TaxID=1076179 RepID=A0A645IVM9_9ZZZZ